MIRFFIALNLIFQTLAFSDQKSADGENTNEEMSLSHQQGKISLNEVPQILEAIKRSNDATEVLILSDTKTNSVANKIGDFVVDADLNATTKNIETDILDLAKKEQPEHFRGFKKWWKTKYVKPSSQEVYWGVIMGGFRGTVASVIWFSSGLDPMTASTLVVGQTLLDFVNQTYFRTVDNVMSGRTNSGKEGEERGSFREMSFRLLYSGFFTYLWRGISGSVNSAASITTIQGNIEVISNVLSKSLSGAYFGAKKGALSRFAAGLIGFQVYMIGSVITSLDLAGITLKSWTVNIPFVNFDLVVKSSTLAIVIFYTGMGLAVKYFPNSFERTAKLFGNISGKVKKAFVNRCGLLFE
ncbi:MAG: hypothetical protein A4S09_02080 [Proteobacteria bacterium SG_bin7]|nr:MAG: hypothetical protein A4S09_02080 [Proteobacteria bacterium SG_bin7]